MISGPTRLLLLCLFIPALSFLQGCAGLMLKTLPVREREAETILSAFARHREMDRIACDAGLDAEMDATVHISGWFSNRAGKLTGYLQALEPGYIKFIALNPIGQPVLVFLSNGDEFKFINILEGKAYMGPVSSETFRKFAPVGFAPESSYYWLTGRLPQDAEITKVLGDRGREGYWLQLKSDTAGIDHMVLFDPEEAAVLRHVVMNGQGDLVLDVGYGEYRWKDDGNQADGSGSRNLPDDYDSDVAVCMVPARITLLADSGLEKSIELRLHSFIPGAELTPDDFELKIPANLEKVFVH